jgi:hypothetical protein
LTPNWENCPIGKLEVEEKLTPVTSGFLRMHGTRALMMGVDHGVVAGLCRLGFANAFSPEQNGPLIEFNTWPDRQDNMNRNATVAAFISLLTGFALLFSGCQKTVPASSAARSHSAGDLAGEWACTYDAPAGSFTVWSGTCTLAADGQFTNSAGRSGTWSVSGSEFTHVLPETNYGPLTASGRISGNSILGNWSTPTFSGPFTMEKK